MGIDIYLSWDGKKEEDKKKQMTGFSINAGDVGYLRASYGMTTECTFLRAIFPKELWEGVEREKKENEEGVPFEFNEGQFKALHVLGLKYLFCAITGKEIDSEQTKKDRSTFENVSKMLGSKGFKADNIMTSRSCDFRSAIMWLNSIFSFFELGMEKQEEKKNPRIHISW